MRIKAIILAVAVTLASVVTSFAAVTPASVSAATLSGTTKIIGSSEAEGLASFVSTNGVTAKKDFMWVEQTDVNNVTKTGLNFAPGSGSWLEISPEVLKGSNALTFAGWLYWKGDSEGGSQLHWQRVFDFGYSNADGTESAFYFTPFGYKQGEIGSFKDTWMINGMGFCMYKNTSSSTTVADDYVCQNPATETPMAGGTWVHVACTVTGNTAKLYYNGQLFATGNGIAANNSNGGISTSYAETAANFKTLYIGRSNKLTDTAMGFVGYMSDVYISTSALSQGEIVKLMNGSGSGGSSGGGSTAGSTTTTGGGSSTTTTKVEGSGSAAETVTVEVDSKLDNKKVISEIKAADETAEIAVLNPGTLSSEVFALLKDSEKNLLVDIVDKSNAIQYSWNFKGADVKNDEVDFDLTATRGASNDKISELVDDSLYPYIINIANDGEMPGTASFKAYVGDMYADDQPIYVYYYNAEEDKLELVAADLSVDSGYITFNVDKPGDYVLTISSIGGGETVTETTTSEVETEDSSQVIEKHDHKTAIIVLWCIVGALAALGTAGIVALQLKARKKSDF